MIDATQVVRAAREALKLHGNAPVAEGIAAYLEAAVREAVRQLNECSE